MTNNCKDKEKFVTSEASTKAWLRTQNIIDKFLNILDYNRFIKETGRFSDVAKKRYGITSRLFYEENGKAIPNKQAFKQIDNAKGIFYGETPTSMIVSEDDVYAPQLPSIEEQARMVQEEDARRAQIDFTNNYLFQIKNIFNSANEIEAKLRPVNKTINSMGSEKNIDDVLKKAGLDPDIRKQFIQLVKENPSLRQLKVSEVLSSYLREFVKDSDRQYYKAIDEPLSNELENILIDYFDRFKIRRQELDNLKEKFGVDSVGVFDVLAKTIYYSKNRSLLTLPEEYGHVFVELLGSINKTKKDEKTGLRVPINPLFKYMFDNIDKWDGYQRVIRDYKDVYVTKEGNMDIYKIKKEAIGQAIGIALVRNYKVQKGDTEFWAKVQEVIDYILNLIKGIDNVSLNTTVDSIAKDILNKNYDKLDRIKKDTSNYNLLSYSETIKNQNKIDGGKALKFMQWFSKKGMLITGSLAYRLQGTTYRPEIDALHDIDNIVPSNVHKISLNKADYLSPEELESSRLYYKYVSEGNYQEAKKYKLKGNIRLNIDEIIDNVKVLQEFKKEFPQTDFLYSFYNEKANTFYITINAIWSENQELKNRFKSYTGSFNQRLENFTKEELEQIYLFDFFLRPESSEQYKRIEDPEFGLSLAHFNYAFYEKLNMMGRAKDAFDYQMWDYYDDKSILPPDFNDRLVYFQIDKSKQEQPAQRTQQVEELFESNPELANAVYEAAGFNNFSNQEKEQLIEQLRNSLFDLVRGTELYNKYRGETIPYGYSESSWKLLISGINESNLDLNKILLGYKKRLLEEETTPIRETGIDEKTGLPKGFNPSTGQFEGGFGETSEKENAITKSKQKIAVLEKFIKQKQQALQLYSAYLDSIFPDSKVKDIVYHGTDTEFKPRDEVSFWTNTYESAYYGARSKTKYSGKTEIVVSALLNIKNPLITTNEKVNYKEGIDFKNKDGIITENSEDLTWGGFTHSQLVVNSKEQIHILGGKQDVEGFKQFVGKGQVMSQLPGVPVSKASKETIEKVKKIAENAGVSFQTLKEYLKGNPNVKANDANGLADVMRGIIAIAEGKEDVALIEEFVHIATATINQVDPQMITEMISKIDRFQIYKQVLAEYSSDPNYQLPNGKPDIRKIKKEAVDKLINELIIKQSEGSTQFPELMDETNRSLIRKWWQSILDWFKGMYRKSNIEIFEEGAQRIMSGEIVGQFDQLADAGDIFLQKSADQKYTPAQLELQQKILNQQNNIKKETNENEKVDPLLSDTEEASNFYLVKQEDGTFKPLVKRVTDRVKAWYKKRFGDKKFSESQKKFNDLKRDLGVKFHYFIEDVHGRYFNSDGTRKVSPGKRKIKLNSVDEDVYQKLEDYFVELVKDFSKDGKNPLVFSEVIVYDPKEQEAGTIDLLIVEEDGKANIFDWKFMSISEEANDVPWFKQGAFGIQLSRYREILKDAYGVKEFGLNRAIPILMEFKRKNPRDKFSDLTIKGINVGSVDASKIEDLRLVPVSEETESTGDKQLDKLISKLNSLYRQISKSEATTDEDREFKRERMNLLKKSIRLAQTSKDISPLIDVIKIMRKEGEQIINDWETVYSKRPATDRDFENSDLSDYADNIREYIAISEVFSRIDDLIGDLIYNKEMEAAAETKAQKEEVAFRRSVLDEIRSEKSKIANSKDEVVKIGGMFADKFIGERNLVRGLSKPEAIWQGVSSYFRGASDSPLASIRTLFKIVTNARGNASADANKLVDKLLEIRKALVDRGGDTRKLIQKIYQRDDDNKLVNKLIYKYKKDFYTGVDDNAIEGNQDKNWLMNNINVDEYKKEALTMLNKRIENLKKIYSENPELRDDLILEEKRKWDISRNDFTGWNNYIIKRHPQDKWFSEEYKEILKDPDLLKLYNFISEVNDEAGDVGYIQNKIHSTFLPFVRKSMAESLAWDFNLSAINNFGNSLSVKADDVGYGSINELTNEVERSIPKYYTYDFTKNEDGTNDYSDVSEDLFKNMILYINHMQKYKYLSEVEGQLQLVKTIETFKNHYETGRFGNLVLEDGKPIEKTGNEENAKMFDSFMRALFYEEKYPLSNGDLPLNISVRNFIKKTINKVAGKEVLPVEENPDAKSLLKMMDAANRAFQLKSLGFEFISGSVNLFGANIQVATQAGNYFKGREFLKNETALIGNSFRNDDERKMFVQLIDTFMPLKDDPTYDKLKESGLTTLTQINFSDWLMVFMRNPEQHVEKSVFKTLLDNTMVEDGKLVNIREYVKKKYANRYSSSQAYREAKNNIDKEIEELKNTKSITVTKQLVDGKLVIPGFDLSNREEIQRLTNLTRTISRNATGGLSDAEMNRVSMSIWTKSMMVFKNWIPKLVDTRFGEFRKVNDDFSVEIDENGFTTGEKYDVGRIRLFLPFLSVNIIKTIKNITDVIYVTENGLSKLDALYKKYSEDYKNRTGEDLNMTREDFNDLIINNLRNQVKELAILFSLFGAALSLGLIAPDDEDDDRADRNAHRFAQRVVDKFIGELSFFYNPLEIEKMLSGSAFPSIGLFSDALRFVNHATMEFTGIDVSDFEKSPEEARKKAQPVKNLAKMFPLTKSLITYGAIFDAEFAKEYDVTIQKESRR